MKNIYSVVVWVGDELFGVWTLPNKPTPDQRVLLAQMIRRTLDNCGMKDETYSTDYTDNLECENFSYVITGINESLNNEFGD